MFKSFRRGVNRFRFFKAIEEIVKENSAANYIFKSIYSKAKRNRNKAIALVLLQLALVFIATLNFYKGTSDIIFCIIFCVSFSIIIVVFQIGQTWRIYDIDDDNLKYLNKFLESKIIEENRYDVIFKDGAKYYFDDNEKLNILDEAYNKDYVEEKLYYQIDLFGGAYIEYKID